MKCPSGGPTNPSAARGLFLSCIDASSRTKQKMISHYTPKMARRPSRPFHATSSASPSQYSGLSNSRLMYPS